MIGGHDTRRRADRIRHCEVEALKYLSRAAALMSEPEPNNKGEALYWTGLASIRIAESDPQLQAHERALEIVASLSQLRRRVPGPYSGT